MTIVTAYIKALRRVTAHPGESGHYAILRDLTDALERAEETRHWQLTNGLWRKKSISELPSIIFE